MLLAAEYLHLRMHDRGLCSSTFYLHVADAAVALIYNKRAAAYSAQGNHRNALRDYEQAINLDPSSPGSRLNRCLCITHAPRIPLPVESQ